MKFKRGWIKYQTLPGNKDQEITDKCHVFRSVWKILAITCYFVRFEKNFEYIFTSCSFQILCDALLKGWNLQKILIILKNVLNESCIGLNFLKKKTQCKHIFIYLRSEARGSKDLHVRNIIICWNEKVHFTAELCKKYRLYWKILYTKIAQS